MTYRNMEKRSWNSDDTALTVGGTSAGGSLAYLLNHRLRDFNPFGKKNVTLIGGVKEWDPVGREQAAQVFRDLQEGKNKPTTKAGKKKLKKAIEKAKSMFRMDSFSGQTLAAADALRAAGIDTSVMRRAVNDGNKPLRRAITTADGNKISKYFDINDFYRPLEIDPIALRNADAVIQVGDGVNRSALESARKSGSNIYRLLSDFGDGNFRQPDYWLGQNWMKVKDPEFYDRLFVPGGAEKDLWPMLGKGRKANVNIGNIAVSPLFENTTFKKSRGKGPKAMFTIGGGSQGYLSLHNYGAPEARKYDFLGKNRTIFDDMLDALRAKHGDKATLDAYLGTAIERPRWIIDPKTKPQFDAKGKLLNAKELKFSKGYSPSDVHLSNRLSRLQELLDPNSARSIKLSKRGPAVQKLLNDIRTRYKGLNIKGSVPQDQIAKAYASSDYIFALPGSTSAEYAAIKGNEHGGLIHLIPSEAEWAPRHFRGNAQYVNRLMQPGAKKNIIDLFGKNRLQALTEAVQEGGFKNWGRRAISNSGKSLDPMVKAIKWDIAMKRLGRLGKLGLLATPAALSGAYLWKSHSKPDGLWDKIKAKLKEKMS